MSPLNFTEERNITYTELQSQTTTTKYTGELGYGEAELYTAFWVAYYLNTYYLRVLCGIGVICNAAVFLTIWFIKPFTTSSFYVTYLAVVDTLALIMKLLYQELTRGNVSLGDGGCGFMPFFGNFTVQYANWVVVIMTLERFVAVWFPLKVSSFCTMSKARISVMVIAILLCGFDLHYFWTFTQYSNGNRTSCGPQPEYFEFILSVWPWLDGFVYGVVPCMLLVVPNGMIIYTLRKAHATQRTMTYTEGGRSNRSSHHHQLTVMLVTVAVAFVVCVLPGSLFYIIRPYWDYLSSPQEVATYHLLNQLFFLLSDCNHALNFVFFFLGGRKFRAMFSDIIFCRREKKQKEKILKALSQMSERTISTSTQISMIS